MYYGVVYGNFWKLEFEFVEYQKIGFKTISWFDRLQMFFFNINFWYQTWYVCSNTTQVCVPQLQLWNFDYKWLINNRVPLRLFEKFGHSTGRPDLITDQPYIFIFSQTVAKIFHWPVKNRAFSKFRVNFWGEIVTKFFWKWYGIAY